MTPVFPLRQSVKDDKKIKEEKEMYKDILKEEHHSIMNQGTPYEDGIEAHLDGVSMQVVKHRMDALRKEIIGPLTVEYVHYYEAGHDIILEKMVQKKD